MHIGAKQGSDWKCTLQNAVLGVINEEKCPGVWMDDELKYYNHVVKAILKKPYA